MRRLQWLQAQDGSCNSVALAVGQQRAAMSLQFGRLVDQNEQVVQARHRDDRNAEFRLHFLSGGQRALAAFLAVQGDPAIAGLPCPQ